MAYDKVVDSAVLDAGLKQIADTIREKGGTSDALDFPTAMAEAIAAIQAGGGGGYKTGTITPEENISSPYAGYSITHNLGKLPDIVLFWRSESQTSPTTIAGGEIGFACAYIGAQFSESFNLIKIGPQGKIFLETVEDYVNNFRSSQTIGKVTDTVFRTGAKLLAGDTYRWLVA